jgi:hypothetical protein
MKKCITLIGICGVFLSAFLSGCSQKPQPIKEGVIWSVVWSPETNSERGLFRVKTLPTNSQPAGEYGVEMSGKLYPTFLEIERVGSSHSQIIPMSQILLLEFGE